MARPGINPSADLRHFTDDERRIISGLSEEWYVTHGGDQIVLGSGSVYRYLLVKPTGPIQEMFNIEREIVVVFSPYPNFEPRTLDAIDRATKHYQALRIERICSMLISMDGGIERKLRDLLRNDQESQVVVPFSYAELLQPPDRHLMRNRFRTHFYSRDLFAFEAPLRKELYFFGRNDLVHDIANRHRSNENSGLFGLRKTGKTSVIYGVQRALAKADGKAVMIDCQNPAFHRRRWNQALHYIITRAKEEFQLDLGFDDESDYTDVNAPIAFERDIERVYQQIGNQKILLVFDEIENITFHISPSDHWAKELDFVYFWQTLRSLFQKTSNVFTYLIAGTNPMCIEVPSIGQKDNPIFNQVPFQYIAGFDVPQTREMVRTLGSFMGLKFDEIIYGKLTEDFGGHPFLIRHVCSMINRLAPRERPFLVGKTQYERAKQKFIDENGNYIEMILNILAQFYSDEYAMLEYLANGDTETFKEFADMSPYYTNHLLGYGVVDKRQDSFTFRIEAVREYLCRKAKYKKIKMTQDEMWGEISERRNALELQLRLVIRRQLHASLGKSAASVAVLDVFGEPRKSKYASLSYEELFNPNKSEIYFEDLRKIVLKYWDNFKHIYGPDKDEFSQDMQCINRNRVDAHAKQIDMMDMHKFRACIAVIESKTREFLS